MDLATKPLVLDLVEWVAVRPRIYAEVMEAWRTSCPRLTVWEDAVEAGLVATWSDAAGAIMVEATARGLEMLCAEGRHAEGRHAATTDDHRSAPRVLAP